MPSEQALLLSWAAFAATFGTNRSITHLLKCRDSGSGGSGGIVIGGKRLPHYNLGIMLLTSVGGVAVHGQEHRRRHPMTALSYGIGAALIVDEFAVAAGPVRRLLGQRRADQRRRGRRGDRRRGLVLAAVPFWSGAAREVLRTRRSDAP